MRWIAAIALPLLMVACAGPAPTDDGPSAQHDQAASAAFDAWLVIEGTSTPVQIAAQDASSFTVRVGLSMGRPVRDWIESSLSMNYMRKSGELKSANVSRGVRDIVEFDDALLTEVGFPAADAAAKDAAFMTLKFSPWITRHKKGDGATVDNPADMAQRAFRPADFVFTIAGLEACRTKISKIDPMVFTPSASRVPGKLDCPNIRLRAEGTECIAALAKWRLASRLDPSVRLGPATLTYLDRRAMDRAILVSQYEGLGIFDDRVDTMTNNDDKISSVELSVSDCGASLPSDGSDAGPDATP